MGDLHGLVLERRGVLRVAGADREAFLQGIVSNDVAKAGPERAIWSAFLTPQGKFLHEFFLVEWQGAYLLDCEAARVADLRRRLSIYKLRSKVSVEDVSAEPNADKIDEAVVYLRERGVSVEEISEDDPRAH